MGTQRLKERRWDKPCKGERGRDLQRAAGEAAFTLRVSTGTRCGQHSDHTPAPGPWGRALQRPRRGATSQSHRVPRLRQGLPPAWPNAPPGFLLTLQGGRPSPESPLDSQCLPEYFRLFPGVGLSQKLAQLRGVPWRPGGAGRPDTPRATSVPSPHTATPAGNFFILQKMGPPY